MRFLIFGFTALTMAAFSVFVPSGWADRAALPALGPEHIVTAEPGVVPSGTTLVVRTNDTLRTRRALRGTVYAASVAEDILDQNGTLLIPKNSQVELAVRPLWYLGPGGVGMTELTLGVREITLNGVCYPVETETDRPGAGGLIDRQTPQVVGGEETGHLLASGPRINVPAETLLAFQIEDPIRLGGYRR